MNTSNYNPNIAIHPGETLKDLLESASMSQTELAERTGLTPKTINEIVQGKNPVTPETALKLSSVFGISYSFWNKLEQQYQESLVRIEADKKLLMEIPFLKKLSCYKDLVKLGFVSETSDSKERVKSLLNFFGVSSLDFIQKTHQAAFRLSKQDSLSQENLAAWLRCGELKSRQIETKTFNKDKLIESLESIRLLTRSDTSVIANKLRDICAEFGVAVVFVPYFSNTFVDGAVRWLSADKALIQVSLRGSYIDQFWFTFFHELGHLLKHGKKDQFVEFEDRANREIEIKEKEADDFASKTLIPDIEFNNFISKGVPSGDLSITTFAEKIGVSAGVVAGRIAHELSRLGVRNVWKRFSHLRPRAVINDPKGK